MASRPTLLPNEVPSLRSIFEFLRHSSALSDLSDPGVSLSCARSHAAERITQRSPRSPRNYEWGPDRPFYPTKYHR
jgi:hypothetical protein